MPRFTYPQGQPWDTGYGLVDVLLNQLAPRTLTDSLMGLGPISSVHSLPDRRFLVNLGQSMFPKLQRKAAQQNAPSTMASMLRSEFDARLPGNVSTRIARFLEKVDKKIGRELNEPETDQLAQALLDSYPDLAKRVGPQLDWHMYKLQKSIADLFGEARSFFNPLE